MKKYYIYYKEFGELKISFDELIDKTNNVEPETLKEKEMFVKGFFLGDGCSGNYRYQNLKYSMHLNNFDINLKEKLQRFCKEVWNDSNFSKYMTLEKLVMYIE